MKKRSTFKRRTGSSRSYRVSDEWLHNQARYRLGLMGNATIFANISRAHPDYGMTPLEHAINSAGRQAAAAKQFRLPMRRGDR
jgi:hypothetical protein